MKAVDDACAVHSGRPGLEVLRLVTKWPKQFLNWAEREVLMTAISKDLTSL